MNDLQAVSGFSDAALIDHACRLIQLSEHFQVMMEPNAVNAFLVGLQSQSICYDRDFNSPVIDFAHKCLSNAYAVVAETTRRYQKDFMKAARDADTRVCEMARFCLNELESRNYRYYTDKLVITAEGAESLFKKLFSVLIKRLLEETVQNNGQSKHAIHFEPHAGDASEIVAMVVPHPELFTMMRTLSAEFMARSEEVSIDIFHAPFINCATLNEDWEGLSESHKKALKRHFDDWCFDYNIPIDIAVPPPYFALS